MSKSQGKFIKAPIVPTVIIWLYALYLLSILVDNGFGDYFKEGDDLVQVIYSALVVVENSAIYICAIAVIFSFKVFCLTFFVAISTYILNIIYFYSVELLSNYEGSIEYITNWLYIVTEYWHIILYIVSAVFILKAQIANKNSQQDAAKDAAPLL